MRVLHIVIHVWNSCIHICITKDICSKILSIFLHTDFVCLACNNKKQVCVEVENVTYKNEDEEGSLEKKGRNGNPLQVFMSYVMCDFGTFIIFKWN